MQRRERLATAMRRATALGRGIVLQRDLADPVAHRDRLFRYLGDPSRKIRSRSRTSASPSMEAGASTPLVMFLTRLSRLATPSSASS